MIYETPESDSPLAQGDIFFPLPAPSIDLESTPIFQSETDSTGTFWTIDQPEKALAEVQIRKVWAIIATQDCDVNRTPLVSLFEIGTLLAVAQQSTPSSPKSWSEFITKQSRLNADWFYLPPEPAIGMAERMAVDFGRVFQIPREGLQRLAYRFRRARLKDPAIQHYRECIAHYFARHAYDEWYPLNLDEFREYLRRHPDAAPFPWQK